MEIVRTVQTFKSYHPIPDAVLGKLVGTPGSPAKVTILSAADLLGMDAIMHPPGPSPRITPEIEQEARNDAARNISEEKGDLVGQWIKAYSEAYARGYSHFHCPHSRWNANALPCIAGARDYAAAVGVKAFTDEAIQGAKIPLAFAQLGLSKSVSPNLPVPLSLARQQGLADRQIYETWFNSLSVGEFRAGAEWWAANRSVKGSSCEAARAVDERWLEGCKEANRRLSASDLRRKFEPEYRVGWNIF